MQARQIRKVVIAGGGTAGWMAAASLARLLGKSLDISLVESDEISTVGVGEATIPTLIYFSQLLKLNEAEFMRETQATFKLGINFENWRNVGEDYFHAFGMTGQSCWAAGFQHFWLKGRELGIASDFGDYCLERVAAKANKFAQLPNNGLNYAYHPIVDNMSKDELSKFLDVIRKTEQDKVAGLPSHQQFIEHFCKTAAM